MEYGKSATPPERAPELRRYPLSLRQSALAVFGARMVPEERERDTATGQIVPLRRL